MQARRSLLGVARGVACGFAICVAGFPTWAQGDQPVALVDGPQTLLSCLTPTAAALPTPVYPAERLAANKGSVVKVRIKFKDASAAPELDFFYNSGGSSEFVSAVRERVSAYRLPCLPAGAEPVVATQVFHFLPEGDRVVSGRAFPDGPSQTCRLVEEPERAPGFPRTANSTGAAFGTVLMELTFRDKTSPPTARVLYKSHRAHNFVSVVEEHVSAYRLDCSPPYKPVSLTQVFRFQGGSASYGLRDMTLKQFVSGLDKLESHRVRFDFSTMGCPFDVRVVLYQPHARNAVRQRGAGNPARHEFIDWLSSVSLRLPPEVADDVLGTGVTVSVPCGVLDLTS